MRVKAIYILVALARITSEMTVSVPSIANTSTQGRTFVAADVESRHYSNVYKNLLLVACITRSYKRREILSHGVMTAIWEDIKRSQTPSWIDPVPHDWNTARRGKLSANHWRVIATVHLPITLIRLWHKIEGPILQGSPCSYSYKQEILNKASPFRPIYRRCRAVGIFHVQDMEDRATQSRPLMAYKCWEILLQAMMEVLGVRGPEELFSDRRTGWHDPLHQLAFKKDMIAAWQEQI
ncbi:hypothetical protein BDN72DRAFT_864716 [Pluteus cervinus]|uniref:Uncharacterized protein n=1 Tax=Pluteus cervinus TaxID=181527 RepID=A0ACD3A2V1_9AGAR|nr:hypothetical protein BDN72DRAFT_864716 [Pluteus cervinus]